jgi:hypothetical protein
MENDHSDALEDLSVRVIGLVHMVRLYLEIGCPEEDIIEQLCHAALVLSERTVMENI